MWRIKWLRWLWLAVIPVSLALPLVVRADSSADVTITAAGYICEAPGGFTLTYISDYEVGISWTKGEGAVNTMVRAAIGRMPESVTDGMEIYYGEGTSTTSWVNMETLSAPVYYRAFSQNENGVWEATGASDQIEGTGMLLIALIILAMGFTITSYIFKKGVLAFAGAGSWMITAIYCFSRSLETWDIYFSLAFLFIGLLLACAFSPLAWRETTPAGEIPEDPDIRDLREEMEMWNRERNQYEFLHSKRPIKKKTRW